jgi:serine/threonine protein kinase
MSKTRDYLGQFRLLRLIRQGSTCDVWEALEENEQTRYALKILNVRSREDKGEIATLKHEYIVGKDLVSPRVIRIHDFRAESGVPFLVMELFSELNLKQALRKGPSDIAYILPKVVEYSAEAIYFMHTKGWIHRDVKPDNFLVSKEGEVKLIDFSIAEKKKLGLAKYFRKNSSTVQGTRSYMSPEQIQGKICDERSDVYSFGCLLFEISTGKLPYTGLNPNDLLTKHLNASIPSPSALNDNITSDFANLIRSMMSKKPESRPESMWDFLKAFRSIQIFKKKPKAPDVSVFDVVQNIKSVEDLIKR